jgi:type I restriction enzyme S subunit
MKPWPKVRLEKVLIHNTDYIEQPDSKEYRKLSVKLYGKGVVLDTPADGAMLKMRRHQLAKSGQVILSEIWGKKGAIGLVPSAGDGALCTSHFFLFDINKKEILPDYLSLIFNANYLENQLGADAKGTTGYAAVRPKTLLACKIPLPPLQDQRRIVARIEELSSLINEARTLRQQAAAEVKVLWASGATRTFDQLAENYPIRDLASLTTIRGGGTPNKSNPFYWSGTIPWITPKDMKVRELHDAIDHISEQAANETAAKLIPIDAVLVVVRGMILAHTFPSAVLRKHSAINQDMKALIPSTEILPEFLCTFFWAHNSRIVDLVEKSTHDTRKLETTKLLNTKIPLPSLAEQHRIVSELQALLVEVGAMKAMQSETATELNALLTAVLDRAFKGGLG